MNWNAIKNVGKFIDDTWTKVEEWTEKPVKDKVVAKMAENGIYMAVNDTDATKILEEILAAQKGKETPKNENIFVKWGKKKDEPVETKKTLHKVDAIPVAQKCTTCGEQVPVEANFCPMCRTQLKVPNARVSNTPPVTAAKVVGIGPKKIIPPTKKSFINKIKELRCPTAKIRARFNH